MRYLWKSNSHHQSLFFLYFVFSWTKSHYYKYIVLHLQLKGVSEGYKGFPGEHLEV